MTKKAAAILSQLRKVFALEPLPPPPERTLAPPRTTRGVARFLFAPEPLAREPERPPRARRGALRLLFAVETLPPASGPATPRRRGRWLRWLFAPEPLDPP
ncbi:hypothetical protein AMOR_44640 [Anaeromyxobacter oryzae]|uniref:Uncharacterized protein n=1 Tax=Anaeromyxobacter oryzae TaxID=2918170 RepID=A0ABN6MWY9_9BACT|nr:hypothetical protein AMOR_44640 [Anaeromyxobacter oryzae]